MAHHAYGVYLADAVARYEEGIAEGIGAVELDPLSPFYRIAADRYIYPSVLAEDYARLGRMDEAFEWLERAYDERDGNLAFIKTEQAYDGLRSDPRFQALLEQYE
jgi:hypothetical protein